MTVKLRELQEVGARYSEKRRGRRMNSRVEIRLEWKNANQQSQTVQAVTRTVNPYGCMVFLQEALETGHRLALTNLATNTSNAAVIAWKGHHQPEGWEYGIELVAPDMDFWGIEL